MKDRLLDLLQSISGGSQLRVASVKKAATVAFPDKITHVKCSQFCAFRNCAISNVSLTPHDCVECYSREIIEGELLSDSGEHYPIIGGIPRILSQESVAFMEKNKTSFSLEWKYSRLGERNWRQTMEFRKNLFIKALGKDPGDLRGKLILDAGCGSGLLAMEMGNSY